MAPRTLPPRDLLLRLLDYDPTTGDFTWRPRPREMFFSNRQFLNWNARYASKQAGCVAPDGYRVITFNSRACKQHRLAWLYVYGEPMPPGLDHIDRNRANNRIANLRAATPSQNQANKQPKQNAIGVRGIRRYKGSFRAHVRINGKGIHLGTFSTAEEAAKAYRDAAIRLFGEFALLDP